MTNGTQTELNQSANGSDEKVANELKPIYSRLPIPQINHENIETYFIQLESWFSIQAVKSDLNKFNTIIATIDNRLLTQVYDAVHNPPENNKYENIKQAIIKNFAESEQKRIQKLVSGLQLGDRKPSHLLNDLRKLKENIDDDLLKTLWMSRLPIQARSIVAAAKGSLSELAMVADAVLEQLDVNSVQAIGLDSTNNSSINQLGTSPDLIAIIATLERRVDEMSNQLKRIHMEPRSSSRSRYQGMQQRDKTPVRSRKSTTCWYHREYGVAASKCVEPCNFNTRSDDHNSANKKN